MVSRLSLSRRICRGVLSVANHRLCSEENSRPVKFTILPLISSANSIAESPICLARRSNLRRLAKSGYQRWAVLIIELRMLVSSLYSASFASRALDARCPYSSLLCYVPPAFAFLRYLRLPYFRDFQRNAFIISARCTIIPISVDYSSVFCIFVRFYKS